MKIKCPDCSTSYEIGAEALGPEGRSVKCAKCGNRWFVSPDVEEGPIGFEIPDEEDATPVPEDVADTAEEADWTADAEEDVGSTLPGDAADSLVAAKKDIPPVAPPPPPLVAADERKFAADLQDEEADDGSNDVETHAKRPKIIVNPDKFRRDHVSAVINWLFRRNFRRLGGFALFGIALVACILFVLMRDNIVKQSPDLASLFQMIGFDVNLRGLEFRNLRTFTEVEDGNRVLVVEGSIRNLLDETNVVPAVRLAIRSGDLQEVYAWTVEPRTTSLNALDETRFRTILTDPPVGATDIQVRFVNRGNKQIVLE
ncbi:zinc-ribbon domain-containing protein [Labrenzia sp. 011]|uniref:zinc-ribbon domain-containing protein n=1 Tax=Labrenzia sp. 011 TaxID=2171494 RepID=UPI000D5150C1|nr:zinc-ribbon domain-containing protein [Labrenzia sp. 011]PVB62067.1 thioredoxin [Labrenzia sp. 011]